jgi:hypothetical protein
MCQPQHDARREDRAQRARAGHADSLQASEGTWPSPLRSCSMASTDAGSWRIDWVAELPRIEHGQRAAEHEPSCNRQPRRLASWQRKLLRFRPADALVP